MLLRDLHMQPREAQHYFDATALQFKDGPYVHVERPTAKHTAYEPGSWFVFCYSSRGSAICFAQHREMDELSAQGVLDHYIQTYGLPDEVSLRDNTIG